MPSALKTAFVTPIPKRQGMNEYDVEDLKNYRPITNLSFCSKVLERVVAQQLSHHLSQHQLNELSQSAYRQYHGTETALTRVQNDILLNADKGHISILVSLDLSAAFDASDHQILLQRLDSIGLTQKTLNWLKSYLTDRYQTVRIIKQNEIGVSTYPLIHGVPQGSVLGPILFNIYMLPLGHLIRSHGVACHFYADDTMLYVSASPNTEDANKRINVIEKCCVDINSWMACNYMKNLTQIKLKFFVLVHLLI